MLSVWFKSCNRFPLIFFFQMFCKICCSGTVTQGSRDKIVSSFRFLIHISYLTYRLCSNCAREFIVDGKEIFTHCQVYILSVEKGTFFMWAIKIRFKLIDFSLNFAILFTVYDYTILKYFQNHVFSEIFSYMKTLCSTFI